MNKKLSYDEWKILINFANDHNINFRVNLREEYTPDEMDQYIEAFSKEKDGKRDFVFNRESLMSKDNPFLEDVNKDDTILKNMNISTSFFINKEYRGYFQRNADYAFNKLDGNMIFDLENGKLFDDKAKEEVLWRINFLKENYPNYTFNISFSTGDRYYTKDEFIKILEVEEYIKNNYNSEYELEFTGNGKLYNKEQIIAANSKINRTVEKLKESNLSPYEKVMFVTKLLNEKKYYMASNVNLSRDLYSVLNTRNIICTGYASLLDVILNELNDENIKSTTETITQTNYFNGEELHTINCVYIKDEKYGIEGYYNLDVNYYGENYNHFMTPVNDVDGWYASKHKSTLKATEATSGTLLNQSIPIYKNNEKTYMVFHKLKSKDNWEEKVLSNTKEFLDTPMGRDITREMGRGIYNNWDALKVINKIIDKTNPIPVEVTQKALEKVARSYLRLDTKEAHEYAKNKIIENVFDSLFLQERDRCQNSFARISMEIEQSNKLEKKNKKVDVHEMKRFNVN